MNSFRNLIECNLCMFIMLPLVCLVIASWNHTKTIIITCFLHLWILLLGCLQNLNSSAPWCYSLLVKKLLGKHVGLFAPFLNWTPCSQKCATGWPLHWLFLYMCSFTACKTLNWKNYVFHFSHICCEDSQMCQKLYDFFTHAFRVGWSGNQGIKDILNDPCTEVCYIITKLFFKDKQYNKVIDADIAYALLKQCLFIDLIAVPLI